MSRVYEGAVFDWIPPRVAQRLAIMAVAFCIWSVPFLVIYSRPTSDRVKQKSQYVRLERQELATRMTAFLHAAIVAAGSCSLVFFRKDSPLYVEHFFEPMTWPDFYAFDENAVFYACLSVGFFVADFILTTVLYEENGVQFVVHAISALGGAFYCAVTGEGLFFLMLLMMFEMSTPSLHLRWILLEYGYGSSALALVNGLMLVLLFTTFRILIGFPVLAKLVYELHTSPLRDTHSIFMRSFFTFASVAMCTLNLFWASKLWKGFYRAVFGRKSKSASKHE